MHSLKALRHWPHSFTCKLHHACLFFVSVHQMVPPLTRVSGGSKGGRRATWASAQNALKVAIFRLKIENFSGVGQCLLPRPLPYRGGGYPLPKPPLEKKLKSSENRLEKVWKCWHVLLWTHIWTIVMHCCTTFLLRMSSDYSASRTHSLVRNVPYASLVTVTKRITYKIATITHRTLRTQQPASLPNLYTNLHQYDHSALLTDIYCINLELIL